MLPFSSSAQGTSQENALAKSTFEYSNRYRRKRGLKPLVATRALNQIAYQHARAMADGEVPFSHEGFDGRVQAIKQYMDKPYSVSENLYMGNYASQQIPQKAVQGWIDSPSHHKNLKGNFAYTGVAVARGQNGQYFVVQLYVGP